MQVNVKLYRIGGMVYTGALGASAEMRKSSSLLSGNFPDEEKLCT